MAPTLKILFRRSTKKISTELTLSLKNRVTLAANNKPPRPNFQGEGEPTIFFRTSLYHPKQVALGVTPQPQH
jgi:hypothetical protein